MTYDVSSENMHVIPKEAILKLEPEIKTKSSAQKRRKNKKKLSLICNLLLLAMILVNGLLISAYIYNLYSEYFYDPVFDEVSITSEYDENYLPMAKVKFHNKDMVFSHSLVAYSSYQAEFKSDSYFDKINYFTNSLNQMSNIMLDYDYKRNDFFELYHQNEFNFKIKSHQLDNDTSCLNIKIKNDLRYYSGGDIQTCVDLKDYSWFGGHESYEQPYWPINNQSSKYFVPYVTGFADLWGAVMERYWLSSAGLAIFVGDDVPLLVRLQNNTLCLKSSRSSAPYKYTSAYKSDEFQYNICTGPVKKLHINMLKNFMGFPTTFPDSLMMKRPVFTTWNYFFKEVNQSAVLKFAHEIVANNYSISQLEIDDKWEKSYGDLDFDKEKFPNVTELTTELHNMGIRVTLWMHPFCNTDSACFLNGTNNGLWVKDYTSGNTATTAWWNGLAAILDTTNPKSLEYFTNKLNELKSTYGIDSFKFDAGETSWLPQTFKLFNSTTYPDTYSQNYVKTASQQGNFIEVRTAHQIQKTPIFFRILDRATFWNIHNGLKSVLTATLQFNLLGYPFVLPDIIGGNDNLKFSDKELYIRWTQLTAFLPAMQFGIPPWFFDNETNVICKNFVELHEKVVFPYISKLSLDGSPIIRPIWWLEPENDAVFRINDQFLVGDEILVAPVLDPGLTEREIYLPKGKWNYINDDCILKGPISKNFTLSLETIPYFYLVKDDNHNFKSCE